VKLMLQSRFNFVTTYTGILISLRKSNRAETLTITCPAD